LECGDMSPLCHGATRRAHLSAVTSVYPK
jgi:hypothetical protein